MGGGVRRRWFWAATLVLALGSCTQPATQGEGGRRAPALGNDSVGEIEVVATLETTTPVDAVPSPDGSAVYFTVGGPPVIFRTTADVSRPEVVTEGAGFQLIWGLSISSDGSRIYTADSGANGEGRISWLPATGGNPTTVPGTEGTDARGVEVVSRNGGDVVYFTGKDPADSVPAVFSIPAEGGERTVLAKGAPLGNPDSVAVAQDGRVFVTDRPLAGGEDNVYRLDEDGPTALLESPIVLGTPAGVAISEDESMLLVSSKNPSEGTAQVLLLDLESGETGVVDKVVGENRSAGGLHRAHHANVFAWADVTRNVYRF